MAEKTLPAPTQAAPSDPTAEPDASPPAEAPAPETTSPAEGETSIPGDAPAAPGEVKPEGEISGESDGTDASDGEGEKGPETTPQLFKIQLEDDLEVEVPVDDLILGYKLSFQAKHDLEEAAKWTESAQKVHEALLKDPMGALWKALTVQYGDDPQAKRKAYEQLCAITEQFYANRQEWLQKPEAERNLLTLKREHAEALAEIELLKKKEIEEARKLKTIENTRKLSGEISDALKAEGLPASEAYIKAVARRLLDARKRNQKTTAIEAAKEVKKQLGIELDEKLKTLDGADPKTVQELFPNLAKKLRAFDAEEIGKLKSKRLPPKATAGIPDKPKGPTVLRDGTWEELFRTK